MRARLFYRLALLQPAIALAMVWDASKAKASPTYTVEQLGLTGSGYSYSSGGTYLYGAPLGLNDNGQVIGYAERFDSAGDSLGTDSWIFNGTTNIQIGLMGAEYSYAAFGGTYQQSAPIALDDAGQVVGESYRYDPTGAQMLGQDSWFFNGASTVQIGLTVGSYSYATTGGTYQLSAVDQLNNAGQALGTSNRYDSNGNNLGEDTWLFSGSSTQQIGLIGSGYGYSTAGGTYQSSQPIAINAAGQVLGISQRYQSGGIGLGQDSWLYDGTSTQQIGLIGSGYSYTTATGTYQSSYPVALNNSGQAVGWSIRYNSSGVNLGQDSWIANGTPSLAIGLTGSGFNYSASGGTFQWSAPVAINDAGQAVGYSQTYTSGGAVVGYYSWLFNGTSTRQIGLNGGVYDNGGPLYSGTMLLNNSGQVVGNAPRYDSHGDSLGQDCWFFDGTATQQIGLTGSNYTYSSATGTFQSSQSIAINKAGQAIGISSRYDASGNPLGQDGWFFDISTDKTSLLQFSVDSANDYSNTDPVILTDTGVVLGSYELFSGSTDEGGYAFYWSAANGFSDLGTLIDGGLSAAGWESLLDVVDAAGAEPDGSPQFILGDGLMDGQSGNTTYLLSASVPEPTTITSILTGATVLCLRRRRNAFASYCIG